MILGIIIVSYHIISKRVIPGFMSYRIKTYHIRIYLIYIISIIHTCYLLNVCIGIFFLELTARGLFWKTPLIEAWAELFTWFSLQRRYLRKSWRPQFFNPMGRFVVVWVFPWSCCKNLYKCSNKGVAGTLKLTAKAPENWPSQKETNIPTTHFQGRTVSFREGR